MVLRHLAHPPFYPLPWLKNGWLQTVAGRYWPDRLKDAVDFQHKLTLSDGDQIVLIENRPASWLPHQRTVVMVHGLAGSAQSGYLIRLSQCFSEKGFRCIRVNLRGCGAGEGLARRLYHSGRSDDLRSVIQWLKQESPDSPVTVMGFSLGANITLKMVGEDGSKPTGNVDSVTAVSPPLDLVATSVHMHKTQWSRIFEQYFIGQLRDHALALQKLFPEEWASVDVRRRLSSLREFDDVVTAPMSGFKSAIDYYQQVSSGPLLGQIQVPTLLLFSMDDPVIDPQAYLNLPKNPHLQTILTDMGGHVGFLGSDGRPKGIRWMDQLLFKWVSQAQGLGE